MPRPSPIYRKKLREAHEKFFEKAKSNPTGRLTAEDTGARALAERRLEFYRRESAYMRGKRIKSKIRQFLESTPSNKV